MNMLKLYCFKCAVAFFFLFFLHETSIRNGQQGISYNDQHERGGCGAFALCADSLPSALMHMFYAFLLIYEALFNRI